MCRRQRAIALSDCQQPVLAHVSGHPDATENATEHVLGLVRVDSAVAVKAENAGHLPAAAEFAALRKSGGIEIGGVLGKAQRVEEVRAGTHPPLSTDSQYAHQHFHNQVPTEVRFCFSNVWICVNAWFNCSRKLRTCCVKAETWCFAPSVASRFASSTSFLSCPLVIETSAGVADAAALSSLEFGLEFGVDSGRGSGVAVCEGISIAWVPSDERATEVITLCSVASCLASFSAIALYSSTN